MKLYLQSPIKLLDYAIDYCDGFAVRNSDIKKLGSLRKDIIDLDKLAILEYLNRDSLNELLSRCDNLLYLSSDLDAVKQGWRFDTALQLRKKHPDIKFGLYGIANSIEEVKLFNEVIGCEILITWWPFSIGLTGRDLDEEWPQLIEPTYLEDEFKIPSRAWLTYILKKFNERIKGMKENVLVNS